MTIQATPYAFPLLRKLDESQRAADRARAAQLEAAFNDAVARGIRSSLGEVGAQGARSGKSNRNFRSSRGSQAFGSCAGESAGARGRHAHAWNLARRGWP